MEKIMTETRQPRLGTCQWCGRHKVLVRYTVYVIDGAYHAARVCDRCLDEYRSDLSRKINQMLDGR